ncbi:hypothetical protein GY45DRAFT_979527 [Cubamyces sp. BRFM 1775]|nr:hypothetical protein GY45DRAFT_979527 [Cubamyces sp. BRFM 1775]
MSPPQLTTVTTMAFYQLACETQPTTLLTIPFLHRRSSSVLEGSILPGADHRTTPPGSEAGSARTSRSMRPRTTSSPVGTRHQSDDRHCVRCRRVVQTEKGCDKPRRGATNREEDATYRGGK